MIHHTKKHKTWVAPTLELFSTPRDVQWCIKTCSWRVHQVYISYFFEHFHVRMWRNCEMLCSFLLRFWHRRFQLLSSYPVESLGTHPLSRESIDRLTTVIFDTSLHSEPSWEVECTVSYCSMWSKIWESNTSSAYVHFSITIRLVLYWQDSKALYPSLYRSVHSLQTRCHSRQ